MDFQARAARDPVKIGVVVEQGEFGANGRLSDEDVDEIDGLSLPSKLSREMARPKIILLSDGENPQRGQPFLDGDSFVVLPKTLKQLGENQPVDGDEPTPQEKGDGFELLRIPFRKEIDPGGGVHQDVGHFSAPFSAV